MDVLLDLAKLVVGALLGYWLSQRGADRQFRRQQLRQRVDEARKVYVEARTLALRVTGALRQNAPGDWLNDEERARVGEMLGRLFDARIALDVHGATAVSIALERVALEAWDLSNWTRASMSDLDQLEPAEREWRAYSESWALLRTYLENSQSTWERWQADQEAVADRWAGLRRVGNWGVWARVRRTWRWPLRARNAVAGDRESDV